MFTPHPTPVLYTCSRITGVTTDPDKIIAYLLNYYITHPSGVFANYDPSLELSLHATLAKVGQDDIEIIRQNVKTDLTNVILRYYPTNQGLDINVNIIKDDDPTSSNSTIDIEVILYLNGQAYTGHNVYILGNEPK